MFVLSLAVAAMLLEAPPIRSDTAAYTARQLADELPSLVALDSSQFGFSVTIDTVGAKGSLGALSRANWHYVLYLTLNAPAASLETLDRSGSRAVVKERALRQLAADTTFLRVLRESVQHFRVSRGEGTNGARAVLPRRIVAVQRLQDVAARFFYPDAILPNGRIQSHVCVGINGVVMPFEIRGMPSDRREAARL